MPVLTAIRIYLLKRQVRRGLRELALEFLLDCQAEAMRQEPWWQGRSRLRYGAPIAFTRWGHSDGSA